MLFRSRIRGTEMFLGRIAQATPACFGRPKPVADPVEVFGTAAALNSTSLEFESIPMPVEGVRHATAPTSNENDRRFVQQESVTIFSFSLDLLAMRSVVPRKGSSLPTLPGRCRGTEMFLGRIAKALPASLARARAVADPVEVFGTAAARRRRVRKSKRSRCASKVLAGISPIVN